MNHTSRAALAAALGAGLILAAGPALAADLAEPTTTTEDGFTVIVLDDTETGATFTPKGGEATTAEPTSEPAPGDAFTFTDDLKQDGVLVATDKGGCTVVGDFAGKCAATLTFAKGTVDVGGLVSFTEEGGVPFTLPVLGGTGAYDGAKGTLTVLDLTDAQDPSDTLSTLTLKLATGTGQVEAVPVGGADTGSAVAARQDDLAEPETGTEGANTTISVHTETIDDSFVPKDGEPSEDFPDGEPEAGDGFAFTEELTQDGVLVGTDKGGCTFTDRPNILRCDVTVSFPRGTIHVLGDGDFEGTEAHVIDIAGGTGAYAGISGTVSVVDNEDESSDLTFRFTTPKSTQVSEVPSGGAATGGGGTAQTTDSALLIGVGVAAIAGSAGLFGAARFTGRRA